MIHHLYVDNYRCFVNFTWQPTGFNLLLGDNGSGKTSLFDLLQVLVQFIAKGADTQTAFPASSLTLWDLRAVQTFEFSMLIDGHRYLYKLKIEHDDSRKRNRIGQETLVLEDGRSLYRYEHGVAQLFRDDGAEGPSFPFDSTRSAVPTIPERNDNQYLTRFRNQLLRIFILSPDPRRMLSESSVEREMPDRELHEYVSWLRHLSLEDMGLVTELQSSLRNVLDGLKSFRLEKTSEKSRILNFTFESPGGFDNQSPWEVSLGQLSDGQRNLVALYTVLHAAVREHSILCLDEPDNYLSIREIQPWLLALKDRVEDEQCQCLLISHHPEIIDYLAAHDTSLFFREGSGPAQVKPFEPPAEEVLLPSQVLARGWE